VEEKGAQIRLLNDLRHVSTRAESADRTQGQKECREWLKEDRKGFLSKLADFEGRAATERIKELEAKVKQLEAKLAAGGTDIPSGEIDEGTARVLHLTDRLRAQYAEEHGWQR
jgi:hypothetical protein